MAIQLIIGKFLLFGGTLVASGLAIAQPIVWPNLFGYRSVFVIVESETVNDQSSADLYLNVPLQKASTGSSPTTNTNKKRNYECSLTDNASIESTDKICKIYEIKTKNSFFLNDLETNSKPNLTSAETPETDDESIKKENLKIANKFFMVQMTMEMHEKLDYSKTIDVKPINKVEQDGDNKNFAKFKPLFVIKDGRYHGTTKHALIKTEVVNDSSKKTDENESTKSATLTTKQYKCHLPKVSDDDIECKILKFSDDNKYASKYGQTETEELTIAEGKYYLIKFEDSNPARDMAMLSQQSMDVKSNNNPTISATFNTIIPVVVAGTTSSKVAFIMGNLYPNNL